MEHITNHLKAEAQNNVEFRALIGEARMGKVSILVPVLRPSHTTKIFTTIFPKKSLQKSLPIYKTVEKIFAVVKKSCSVYGQ